MDLYDFGARNYDPAIGRWMNIDPLAEDFYQCSTYTSMNDNPINFIDPTGMGSLWIPEVDDNGTISYTAEKGDSANSLSEQFGVSQKDAEKITGTTGDTEIKEGTSISGEQVAGVTGNEVLKLNLKSKDLTDGDIANQTLFSIRNETINDNAWVAGGNPGLADYTIDVKNYFTNDKKTASTGAGGSFYGFGTKGFTTVNVNGVYVKVWVNFSSLNYGLISSVPDGRQRYLPSGNTTIEFFHPTAYNEGKGKGIKSIRNPILSIITKKDTKLLNYMKNEK